MQKIRYYKLPWEWERKYKYEMEEDIAVNIYDITKKCWKEGCILHSAGANGFVHIFHNNVLKIYAGYQWDGCSGPTIDTVSTMRAGLIHDALYQMLREGFLPFSVVDEVDKLFHRILKEDGVGRFRAWYYFKGVNNWFAHRHARPVK